VCPPSEPCSDGSGKKNLTKPRQQPAQPPIGTSTAVHNIWQVDAKEHLQTLDGKAACYLTLTDEKSGAWLGATAFPYGRISQVPVHQVRLELMAHFLRWGKPGAMRVDNGAPLGHPTRQMTSPLALWLIAMDVDMIFNKPKCPQQNGVVERMQATSANWIEVEKINDLAHLQLRLDQESVLQRQLLPVKRLNNKTRFEAFPQLETAKRPYQADDFDEQRVYGFLAKKIYTRKVSSAGTVAHYQQVFSVGAQYKAQFVQIRFDVAGQCWQVFNHQQQIKAIPAAHLDKASIENLTTCQRTYKTAMSHHMG
jgi:hypothetical protein